MDDIIWRLDIAILNSQSNTGNRQQPAAGLGQERHQRGRHPPLRDPRHLGRRVAQQRLHRALLQDGRIKPDISYWNDEHLHDDHRGLHYTSSFGGTSAATPESAAGTLGLSAPDVGRRRLGNGDPQGATVFERAAALLDAQGFVDQQLAAVRVRGQRRRPLAFQAGLGPPQRPQVAYERAATSFIVDEADHSPAQRRGHLFSIDVPGRRERAQGHDGLPGSAGHDLLDTAPHQRRQPHRSRHPPSTTYRGNVGLEDGTESDLRRRSRTTLNTVENVFVKQSLRPAYGRSRSRRSRSTRTRTSPRLPTTSPSPSW